MVRPVDLQVNMAKAVYASQAQQAQQEDPQNAQRQAAAAAARQHIVDHSRTLPAEEARHEGVRTDDRDESRRRDRDGRRRPPVREAAADDEDRDGTEGAGHIDIVA